MSREGIGTGRSPVSRNSMLSYILTFYYRLRNREPLNGPVLPSGGVGGGGVGGGALFLHPWYPTVQERGGGQI